MIILRAFLIVTFCLSLFCVNAQKHSVDVSGAGLNPVNVLENWGGKQKNGKTVSSNNYYIIEDGKPLALIMGEFHPQRYPHEEWENALVEIKAGGINTISFYVFWSLIEEVPGKFDFTGNNDIRTFLQLCKKHNLKAVPRIGPFNNSEFLAGGLPPWIYGMPYTERSNDPGYLKVVKRYYEKLSEQMKGLYWQQGGPIYYVQLENELSNAPVNWETYYRYAASDEHLGPVDGESYTKHFYNLRDMAQLVGINPLYFMATAWGKNPGKFPKGFLPFYGGYMYLGQPGKSNSSLSSFRTFGHVGEVPVGFCELGAAGTPTRIDYNIYPPALSATTTAITALGSVETLTLGYYMYHGGSNPISPRFGFMAKQNNCSLISYDYRAPLSEYGEPRPAYYLLRPINQFLLNYSDKLANTQCVNQDVVEENTDYAWLRIKARSDNNSGFLITSYYGNVNPFPETEVQIDVKTTEGSILIPSTGKMSIKNGDNYIFPFNLVLENGVTLISASAQPTSILKVKNENYQFFISPNDQIAEFVVNNDKVKTISYNGKEILGKNGKVYINVNPDRGKRIKIVAKNGEITNLILLTNYEVEHSIEAIFGGQKYLLISEQDVVNYSNIVALSKCNMTEFSFQSFPKLRRVKVDGKVLKPSISGMFFEYATTVKSQKINANIERINSSKITIQIDEKNFEGLNNIYTSVDFNGSICRLFDLKDGAMIGDEFRGPWRISLRRFKNQLTNEGLMLRASPDDVYEKQTSKDDMLLDQQAIVKSNGFRVNRITLEPEYKVIFVIAD